MTQPESEQARRSDCPISSALDVLGDTWSLLIIRDLVVHGTRTYTDFRDAPEGISTNILATRLKVLAGLDLIERVDPDRSTRGNAYRLTARGAALKPTLVEFLKWAQSHLVDIHPSIHEDARIR
jgi:DNA-binding HxlR family transcriptional regulator